MSTIFGEAGFFFFLNLFFSDYCFGPWEGSFNLYDYSVPINRYDWYTHTSSMNRVKMIGYDLEKITRYYHGICGNPFPKATFASGCHDKASSMRYSAHQMYMYIHLPLPPATRYRHCRICQHRLNGCRQTIGQSFSLARIINQHDCNMNCKSNWLLMNEDKMMKIMESPGSWTFWDWCPKYLMWKGNWPMGIPPLVQLNLTAMIFLIRIL